MKTTVQEHDFINAFKEYNREDNFSYEGRRALFEFFEEYEELTREEIELDVIALCCDYTEYKDLDELKENYTDIESMEELEERTLVIMINDKSFIIKNF